MFRTTSGTNHTTMLKADTNHMTTTAASTPSTSRDEEENSNVYVDSSDDEEDSTTSNPNNTHTSQTSTDVVGTKRHAQAERATLGKSETQQVGKLRRLVYVVVLLVAAGVSTVLYVAMHHSEMVEFETQFHALALKLLYSVEQKLEAKLEASHGLANAFTIHAETSNVSFPFVTLPHMELVGSNARVQAQSVLVAWFPLVTQAQRVEWQAYAEQHHDWIKEAYQEQVQQRVVQDAKFGLATNDHDKNTTTTTTTQNEFYFHDQLWDSTGTPLPDDHPGPFLPFWQASPVLLDMTSHINYNPLDDHNDNHHAAAFATSIQSHKTVLSTTHPIRLGNLTQHDILPQGQYRHQQPPQPQHTTQQDPAVSLLYPVFDTLDVVSRQVAGVLRVDMLWSSYFRNILPETVVGIVVVLTNTQHQTLTFQVHGDDEVVFLGHGDHHDPHYDEIQVTEDMTHAISDRAGPHTQAYGAAEWDTEHCAYTLTVYPSSILEQHYVTSRPILMMVVVLAVFGFTTAVFACYDYFVEQRQVLVMDRAVKSSAIVSSLYPEHVRQRLMEESEETEQAAAFRATNAHTQTAHHTHHNQTNMSRTLVEDSETTAGGSSIHRSMSMPIADQYENTTILFADLAGFTKWSASRKPEEVFLLLETLYQAFDRIAARRRVYKIETIGDCYVAATGLPNPQANHAVIMTKFANDCQAKMIDVLSSATLLDRLGEDTKDLGFRVGMHSGSITGGVLRGQKARFQLFGDTMNTASRMESNGVKGKIHVSEATANELRARGKGHWVLPREDLIDVKGKGQMKTYWVQVVTHPKCGSDQSSCYSGMSEDYSSSHPELLPASSEEVRQAAQSLEVSLADTPATIGSYETVRTSSSEAGNAMAADNGDKINGVVSVCSG